MKITLIIDQLEEHDEAESMMLESVYYGDLESGALKTTMTITYADEDCPTWKEVLNNLVVGVEKHYGYDFDLEKL